MAPRRPRTIPASRRSGQVKTCYGAPVGASWRRIYYPSKLEKLLRLVLVTPDMHRIHHSVLEHEQRGNLSGGLSWWDHLFGTYIGTPASDYRTMQLGLSGYSAARASSLRLTLLDPFAR